MSKGQILLGVGVIAGFSSILVVEAQNLDKTSSLITQVEKANERSEKAFDDISLLKADVKEIKEDVKKILTELPSLGEIIDAWSNKSYEGIEQIREDIKNLREVNTQNLNYIIDHVIPKLIETIKKTVEGTTVEVGLSMEDVQLMYKLYRQLQTLVETSVSDSIERSILINKLDQLSRELNELKSNIEILETK